MSILGPAVLIVVLALILAWLLVFLVSRNL
jgi:hypothetical protein